MKVIVQQLAIIVIAMTLAACGSSSAGVVPIDVSKGIVPTGSYPLKGVKVTAVVDKVTITGITVDRGNCKNVYSRGVSRLPAELGYGQSFEFTMPMNCNVREVVIQTNLTPVTATFSQ